MALLASNGGKEHLLAIIFATDYVVKVYTNNVTVEEAMVLGDFEEATEDGYAEITLDNANWVISTTSDITSALYPEITFSFTESITARGYFVTTSDGATLIWAEEFSDGPYEFPIDGGTVSFEPEVVFS